jgi:hypothetical protein
VKKFLAFQYNKPSFEIHEIGNEIYELFNFHLSEHGYKVITDHRYDPDWIIRLQKEGQDFILVLGYIRIKLHFWLVSFEDTSYQTLEDKEILGQITSILNEIIIQFPDTSNVAWYENLDFLK